MKRVKEILSNKGSDVWGIRPDASVYEAVCLLAEKDIGALAVVENDNIIGIISERDYTRRVMLKSRSSQKTKVSEIMSTNLITVSPDDDVQQCMESMSGRRVRHLPVLDGEKLVGMISIGDLVKAIIAEQQSTIVDLEKYITG
ncbi:MAG: CBS domain-containing protein [Gammaproteobacteria bacterium]|nr:CBS domain-containing protein [Gammaproteobacteria bacterium]